MTELEACRILAEHAAECPRFVRGNRSYDVRKDCRVDVYRAVGKSGQRWVFVHTCERDFYGLPSDVRFPCNRLDAEVGQA